MSPDRKRRIRLIAALGTAVLLAVGLIYTSFSASSEAREPSDLIADSEPGASYDLTGEVVDGSIERDGRSSELSFEVADRDDPEATIPVVYSGQIPDPFREGREVIVTGEVADGTFMAEHDSLITKCPSKFEDEAEQDPNVVIDPALG
ncbi:cytochrome c maturation protein CcmE [Thermoleophilia bacterium SCSIO 60948]|nr:cytochrome c maturation protein CcmE [Thermoleophilia bacterium SCSIO 60948]